MRLWAILYFQYAVLGYGPQTVQFSLGDQSCCTENNKKTVPIKQYFFLQYGATHILSMKLLAVTKQMPQANYLCSAHVQQIYSHSLW